MKDRIVSSKEIAECPGKRLDAQHYIPVHKKDQCDRPTRFYVRCKTCGDVVQQTDRREHLASHHPGAWAFDYEQVVVCFEHPV